MNSQALIYFYTEKNKNGIKNEYYVWRMYCKSDSRIK